MSKFMLLMSFISLGILLTFGIISPDSPVMWLASTSGGYEIIRAVFMVLLLGLLVTNPPRNVYFRALVGTASLLLASWCLSATYDNGMKLVDTLSLLQAAIGAGIAALEPDYEEEALQSGNPA